MKYTKEQRLDIGRQIYDGELSRYEAAEKYNINDQTARDYMRLYRDVNNLPPKRAGRAHTIAAKSTQTASSGLDDLEAMSKEELIEEIVRARINEARLKKGYEVEGDGKSIFITHFHTQKMRGGHAGLTEAERKIPFIVIEKK